MDYERKKKFIVNVLYLGIIAALVYLAVQYGLGLLRHLNDTGAIKLFR